MSLPNSIDPKKEITWVMVGCMVIATALVGRAAWVQLGSNPRLENMARRQFQSKMLIRPRRGLILDRNGEPLAANVETQSLAANPLKIKNRRTLARLLSKATDIPYSKLIQRFEDKKEFAWIKRHLTEGEMARLKKWKIIDADGDLVSGLWMVKESKRVYPHGELAAHTLGDTNVDSEGLEGVELWLNERLRGKVVSMSAIKDAFGRPAFIDSVAAKNVQEGRDGEPVSLTIDASLQFAVEEELRNSVRKFSARSGSVIVMNAVTGEILALANHPPYNPNEKGAPADRRRNRAITDGFEPGSTMKPILLAGALNNGMKLTDQIWGELGKFSVQGKKVSEAEAHEKFKWLTLKKIIQVSSNIGAAKLALKLGADKYLATLNAFGFGAKTDVGFPGEISGRMPPRKAWQPLTTANIGFGHGILVTPIQMVRAYAAFLNGGWLVQPTILKSQTESPDPAIKPVPPRRIMAQKAADQVLEALASVADEGGTGGKANLVGYRVAGKTGTAQKVDSNTGSYSRSKYVASFIGFPLDVEPRVVIFASIDEPHGAYYASEVAAPLFREVLNAVANRFSLPTRDHLPRTLASAGKSAAQQKGFKSFKNDPAAIASVEVPKMVPAEMEVEDTDALATAQAHPVAAGFGSVEGASPASISEPAVGDDPSDPNGSLHWQGHGMNGKFLWKMPSLKGLTPREAIQVLKDHHFTVELKGSGLVRSQFPEPGKVLADGDTIKLQLQEP